METLMQKATLREYEGDRDPAGLCHGQGRAVFNSGSVYSGEWRQGCMHGQGDMLFPDGICYSGTFASDSICGSGTYTWQGATFDGEVLDGFRHGYGRLTVAEGSSVMYEGLWQHGKRHGPGGVLYYNADKTAYYQGDWADDMKHGQGTSVWPSGNTYTGAWVQDQRQGLGSMHWKTRGQQFTGHWVQGLPDGFGEHTWEQQRPAAGVPGSNHAMHVMHNRYVGMFKEGQRHGEGTLYYSSGARYEGQWQRGRKHGQGVYVFEDGSVFRGQFLDDRPVLATGAVLGAESTFAAMHSANGELQRSTAGAAAACNSSSSSSSALARAGLDVPGKEDNQGPAQLAASAQGATKPTAAAARKGAPAISKAVGRAEAASASTSGSAASKPAARNAAARTGSKSFKSSKSADAAAATAAASKRASTAASSASAASSATSRAGTADSLGQGATLDSSSSPGGSSFGPATSVMQLYISDLLLEYDAQAAAAYKAVSNLLVGCSTELRLLYDRYSACPSPLSDASALGHSWALQACQLWELLRDANLLCRHVSLLQVGDMLGRVTAPPPAVLQHRQQVEPETAAALQRAGTSSACCHGAAGVQLLFRDFCEVLVRVAAARYPLLPSLEMQVQQALSYHLLPLLGGATRHPAGPAARASAVAVMAPADALGGCEQHLRSGEVVQYLRGHRQLLEQLFRAFAAAGDSGGSAHASTAQQDAPAPADVVGGTEQGSMTHELPWQQQPVLVRQVLARLQETGVLERSQLSVEAAAACLLHSTLAVTDPQGVRACIEDAASEASSLQDAASSVSTAPSPDAALRRELLFWTDAPLTLQDVLWGLVRLAALLPQNPAAAAAQANGAASSPPGRSNQQPPAAAETGSDCVGSTAARPPPSAADQALLHYQELFVEGGGCGDDWDASLLLPRLQALLEGASGVFRAVLGCQLPSQQAAGAGSEASDSGAWDEAGVLGLEQQDEVQEGGEEEEDEEGCSDGVVDDKGADQKGVGEVWHASRWQLHWDTWAC